jgi:hypothetical protein
MTRTTSEFDQRIADWLEDDPSLAPPQVVKTVFAALPSIRQRRRGWFAVGGRTLWMPNSLRLAAALAIVAIVGVGALAYVTRGPSAGVPSTPGPSITTTITPTYPPLKGGALEPGRYAHDGDGLRVIMTVPAGWEGGAFNLAKAPARELPDGLNLLFRQPSTVFRDPCAEGTAEVLGPEVADLVTALADLPHVTGFIEADATISGFSGKHLTFTVDTEGITCVMAMYGQGGFIRAAENGQREDLWILDVAGTRLVIDAASFPETAAGDRAELEAIVDTLLIEPTD